MMNTAGIAVSLEELVALKAVTKTLSMRSVNKLNAPSLGTHLSKLRGRGMDFAEARSYQAGDDIRHMEWRLTARSGKAHIKLYQEERQRPIFLVVDMNPSMHFATRLAFKSVIAARLAAMFAWLGVAHADKVGGVILSDGLTEFRPKARQSGILPFLKALSDISFIESQTQAPLSQALSPIMQVVKPGSLVIVLSDFYTLDELSIKQLKRLGQHNALLGVLVQDVIEGEFAYSGSYTVEDLRGQQSTLNMSSQRLREEYHQYYQNLDKRLAQAFQLGQWLKVKVTDNLPTVIQKACCFTGLGGQK